MYSVSSKVTCFFGLLYLLTALQSFPVDGVCFETQRREKPLIPDPCLCVLWTSLAWPRGCSSCPVGLQYLSAAEVRLCAATVQRQLRRQQVREAGTCSCRWAESASGPRTSCGRSAGAPPARAQARLPPAARPAEEADGREQPAVTPHEPYETATGGGTFHTEACHT